MTYSESPDVIELITNILTKNNCQVISFEKGKRVNYMCSCGNETATNTGSIRRETWGGCAKCSNQRRGNLQTYEFARTVFEEGGETLPVQEYKGNKTKLFYTCSNCSEEAHVSLSEFRRGRRCEKCKFKRAMETNVTKYGVANQFQREDIKEKIKENNLEKYGVDHHMKVPEILKKARDTNTEKYGIEFAFHSKESFEKSRETCLDIYGTRYPIQNEDIFHKRCMSAFSRKEYVFPSGRLEYCQGYEPRCFDYLMSENYDEDDLVVGYKDREPIWYDNPVTNQRSRYFPDGFIKSENAVIEVKSDYTLELDLAKNLAKFDAVTRSGLNLNLYVFDKEKLLYVSHYSATNANLVFNN
jgi:DNA-directed RNA polymerase subunit RPC12/RpoP